MLHPGRLVQRVRRPAWPRWPMLDRFGTDLTLAAMDHRSPSIPLPHLNRQLDAALLRQRGANAALIGPSGSGRRTAIRQLAETLLDEAAPRGLAERQLFEVEATGLLVGTRYRGELEERLGKLAEEVSHGQGRLVVALLGAPLLLQGEAGALSGAAALARLLESGGWILPLTPDEWSLLGAQLSDPERLLQPIGMPDLDDGLAGEIAAAHLDRLTGHHGLGFEPEAPRLAVALARRYQPTRALPGSAIDLLDQAAALARLAEAERVCRIHLLQAVVDRTALPLAGVDLAVRGAVPEEADAWLDCDVRLARRVVGQTGAVRSVAAILRRSRVGLGDPRRPLGSLLCIGPTGVGKTELARAVAEFIFGDETALVRVDMSEYLERHAVARLIGAPPGYVGFELPGQLTDPVRRRPFSVVLLDEIEKAHADVLNLLLQVLEDGRLTDGHGRTVDFHQTLIILTSNVGSVEARELSATGPEVWRQLAWRLLRPELLNRLDEIVVFSPLSSEAIEEVVEIQVRRAVARLEAWQVRLAVTARARHALAVAGYDERLGARPLRRLIEREVVDPLAEGLLAGRIRPGEELLIDGEIGRFYWSSRSDAPEEGRARTDYPLAEHSSREEAHGTVVR